MQKTSLLFSFILFYITLLAQPYVQESKLDGIYMFKDNFCSASLLFKPNGEFFYEGGCEERSNIAKGNYKIEDKKITLITINTPIQYSIQKENNITNRRISITLTDNEGTPLAYSKVLILPTKRLQNDTLKSIEYLQADSAGQVIVYTSKVSAISFDRYSHSSRFKYPENIYHWESVFDFKSDNLTIQFNYPIFCLRYPEIVVTGFVPELQLTNDKNVLIDKNNNIYQKAQN